MQNKVIIATFIALIGFGLYITSPANTMPKCEELNQTTPEVCNTLDAE